MRIDNLEEPRFTHGEVLKLLPSLAAKNLRNWSEFGLVDHQKIPGRGNPKKYNALGIIKLAAMYQAVRLGMGPTAAAEMANGFEPRILELWAARPDVAGEHGERKIVFDADASRYKRLTVWCDGDNFICDFDEPVGMARLLTLPTSYFVFEVDLLAIDMLNRIHRHVAGLPVD